MVVGIDGKNVSTIWLGRDDNGETKLTGASGALQIYKDYLNRVVIEKLKLGQPSTIKWVGINAYGSWSCGSNRTIPVWANKDQNFCASAQTRVRQLLPLHKLRNRYNLNNQNHQNQKVYGMC